GLDHHERADHGDRGRRVPHRPPADGVHPDLLPGARRTHLGVRAPRGAQAGPPAGGQRRPGRARIADQLRAGGDDRCRCRRGRGVAVGIGLWILGVPLVVPLATLVFIGAFIPIIGAVVAGGVAVLIALVSVGWIKALVLLAIVTAVMQLEGHVLQPILLGRAVKLHPLAVILAITGGLIVSGIAGALLAVPLLAVLNAGAKSMIKDQRESGNSPDSPEPVDA